MGIDQNLFLKRTLKCFIKIPLFKKILKFQDRILFFIKKHKKTATLLQVTGW